MKKSYLLSYSDATGKQEQVRDYLDKIPEITHWRYDLPHAFYLVSTANAKTLAIKFQQLAGDKALFIITEITDNSWGWLTPESWHLIQHKEYKPKAG